jgi:hypothetical protein
MSILVDDSTMSKLLRRPFNPPIFDREYGEIDFIIEFENVCTLIKENCFYRASESEVAIWSRTPAPPSRLISVNIQAEDIWTPQLVPKLSDTLSSCACDYAIWIFHEVVTLPFCNVFVTRQETFGSGDQDALCQAGFVLG